MKLDRITALVRTPAVEPRGAQERKPPLPGETILLICEALAGEDLLATVDGRSIRLSGLRQLRGDLQPGDAVLMRVLATEPLLELELYGEPVRPASAEDSPVSSYIMRQHAMQLDQAALSQIAWHIAGAAELARSWQRLAQSRWAGQPAQDEPDNNLAALPSAASDTASQADPSPMTRSAAAEQGLLPVYAWNGRQMLLGLAQADDGLPRAARRRRPLALRLELEVPALGRVVLHVQWLLDGIQLLIAVEQAGSAQAIRELMPSIASAMAGAHLRLVRCRLAQGTMAVSRLREAPPTPTGAQIRAEVLSLALYRALAEAAIVLMNFAPDRPGFTPGSR